MWEGGVTSLPGSYDYGLKLLICWEVFLEWLFELVFYEWVIPLLLILPPGGMIDPGD